VDDDDAADIYMDLTTKERPIFPEDFEDVRTTGCGVLFSIDEGGCPVVSSVEENSPAGLYNMACHSDGRNAEVIMHGDRCVCGV
jgi:hypothetical protein